jgi:hypothetical protein
MTDHTTEMFSSHFRNRHARGPKTNAAYLALWIAYQRGALSAAEFMRNLEQEFLRNMEQLEAGGQDSSGEKRAAFGASSPT